MKAHDSRRPIRRRTAEELAKEHEDALRWRARLRSEVADAVVAPEGSVAATSNSRERSERSRFAAAIARAEFGRFYFKDARPAQPSRRARQRNGQTE